MYRGTLKNNFFKPKNINHFVFFRSLHRTPRKSLSTLKRRNYLRSRKAKVGNTNSPLWQSSIGFAQHEHKKQHIVFKYCVTIINHIYEAQSNILVFQIKGNIYCCHIVLILFKMESVPTLSKSAVNKRMLFYNSYLRIVF